MTQLEGAAPSGTEPRDLPLDATCGSSVVRWTDKAQKGPATRVQLWIPAGIWPDIWVQPHMLISPDSLLSVTHLATNIFMNGGVKNSKDIQRRVRSSPRLPSLAV